MEPAPGPSSAYDSSWGSESPSLIFLAPFPSPLSCRATAQAQTSLEGRVPRWLQWTGLTGQGRGPGGTRLGCVWGAGGPQRH